MPEAISTKIGIERILLCTQGESSKFWRVRVEGNIQVVCYGRIGTEGHELTKTFEGSRAASKATEKLIAEKLGKGYRKVSEAEAQMAHAAARSADGGEGVPITPSRKLLRSGKGQGQLCLLFATEDEGDRPLVGHSIMPLETIPPTLLSLEF